MSSIHIRDSHRLSHLTALNGQVGIGLGVGGDLQRNIRAGSVDYGTNRIAYAHIGLFDGNTVKVEVIARNHRRIAGIGKLILQTVDFQLRYRYRERSRYRTVLGRDVKHIGHLARQLTGNRSQQHVVTSINLFGVDLHIIEFDRHYITEIFTFDAHHVLKVGAIDFKLFIVGQHDFRNLRSSVGRNIVFCFEIFHFHNVLTGGKGKQHCRPRSHIFYIFHFYQFFGYTLINSNRDYCSK